MSESPKATNWQHGLENQLNANRGLAAGFVLLLAFVARLWKASGTFLNPDEAMHFLAAHKASLAEAYRAGLTLAHPPLLILLLHVWSKFGRSELFLRLPSVIAGTIFCWIFWRWLTRLLGPAVGWVGFILVSLLPAFVELSSEIRQYALLLCFMMAAAHLLEIALEEDSGGKMLASFFFLYLAMLTHFSAILFAGAWGAYSLWRLLSRRHGRSVVAVWIAGQAGALGLFVSLYFLQISKLKEGSSAKHMQVLLANSYFHAGRDHLLGFVFARTFGVLQYTFGQLAVGDIAGLLFVAGFVLLLAGTELTETDVTKTAPVRQAVTEQEVMEEDARRRPGPSSRQLACLLMLPFVINAAAAIADLYPYGGTRHSAFLIPFAIAGVSLSITRLTGRSLAPAVGIAMLMVVLCQVFGVPHRPFMRREDQRRSNMTQALDAIRHSVAAGDVIFVDFQTNSLLRFYLCPEAIPESFAASDFRTYSCGGYRVISTGPETNVLTANSFLLRWNDMVKAFGLKSNQAAWAFQAGWDIGLGRELPEKVPQFRDLKPAWFGSDISLFKIEVSKTEQ